MEILEVLITWTPYMLGGFVWNILIATLAVVIGTLLGTLIVLMRFSSRRGVAASAEVVSSFFRNVPTLVLLFYLAILVPSSVDIAGTTIYLPPWLKASLALASAPLAFTAWNLYTAIDAWKLGDRRRAMLFLPNWLSGFLITVLTSSTASLVGVSELVGRSNTIIAVSGTHFMLPIYFYASLFFFLFCLVLMFAVGGLKKLLLARFA